MFRLKPEPASDENIATLDSLYHEYRRRILWKVNEIENKKHDKVCTSTNMRKIGGTTWCQCRTRQEEIHEWEEWAAQNFGRPEYDIEWLAAEKARMG
jgi:hypothetical protein